MRAARTRDVVPDARGVRFKDQTRLAIDSDTMNRRHFLRTTAAAVAFPAVVRSAAANSKVTVAIVGVNGRGGELALGFAGLSNVEIAAICDVDERPLAKTIEAVSRKARSEEHTSELQSR